MERRNFFISYTNKDTEKALWIADVLTKHGYTFYIQQLDIKPGDNFLERINAFLKNSDNFLAVWSEAYFQSPFCMTEMQAAYNQLHKKQINAFLPVRIDNYPMEEPLYAVMVRAELFGSDEKEVEQNLIEAVNYVVSRTPELGTSTKEQDISISVSGTSTKEQGISISESNTSTTPKRPKNPNNSTFIRFVIIAICFVVLVAFLPKGDNTETGINTGTDEHELSGAELYQMGYNYHYGENGVEQDYTKARQYYEQAVAKGNASALNNLGWLYDNGYGVEQDYTKAREYYEQAKEKGILNALNNLGWLYQCGCDVEVDYTKAREYYEQAAEKGNVNALNNLGVLYNDGLGVAQSYTKAREYYEQAAEKDNEVALYNLGKLYEHGHGMTVNYDKALNCYQQAADKGNADAATRAEELRAKLNE